MLAAGQPSFTVPCLREDRQAKQQPTALSLTAFEVERPPLGLGGGLRA